MAEWILLVLLAAWAVAISIAVLAILRQLAIYQLAVQAAGPAFRFDLDMDGLKVGAPVPPRAMSALRKHADPSGRASTVVMISPSCPPCRQIAAELAENEQLKQRAPIFLVPGRANIGERMVNQLSRAGATVILDPEAHELAQALNITSTPFAVTMADGTVVAKKYIRGSDDLLSFVEDTEQRLLVGALRA